MNHYFRTLDLLEAAAEHHHKANNKSLSLENLRDAWGVAWGDVKTTKGSGPLPSHAGPCAVATEHQDIVRTAGPPTQRFFLQDSEIGPDYKRICWELGGLEDCMKAFAEGLFALPLGPIRNCVGLSYDLSPGWNSSCDAYAIDNDLRRAHARSFGLSLVGDLEGWAKHRMSTAIVERYRAQVARPGVKAPDGF